MFNIINNLTNSKRYFPLIFNDIYGSSRIHFVLFIIFILFADLVEFIETKLHHSICLYLHFKK